VGGLTICSFTCYGITIACRVPRRVKIKRRCNGGVISYGTSRNRPTLFQASLLLPLNKAQLESAPFVPRQAIGNYVRGAVICQEYSVSSFPHWVILAGEDIFREKDLLIVESQ
jgi:hypothetical protein